MQLPRTRLVLIFWYPSLYSIGWTRVDAKRGESWDLSYVRETQQRTGVTEFARTLLAVRTTS